MDMSEFWVGVWAVMGWIILMAFAAVGLYILAKAVSEVTRRGRPVVFSASAPERPGTRSRATKASRGETIANDRDRRPD